MIVHETATRLRLRCPGDDAARHAMRARLGSIPGVRRLRQGLGRQTLIVEYDGRVPTRASIVASAAASPADAMAARRPVSPRFAARAGLDLGLLAGAVALLPPPWRPAAAAGFAVVRGVQHWRAGDGATAVVLESASAIATALTGNAAASATSMVLGAIGRRASARLLGACDDQLWAIARDDPQGGEDTGAREAGVAVPEPGDLLPLSAGDLIPCDGLVIEGELRLDAAAPREPVEGVVVGAGERVGSGARVGAGKALLLVERTRGTSRAARLRRHLRHAILARDQPGPMSPDLQRLASLPLTAAGVVYAVTGDAQRSAPMLQADPQEGLAMSMPVARDASIFAMARAGILMTGLDAIERLASATTVVLEDIGILTEPVWRLDTVRVHGRIAPEPRVAGWLAAAAGVPVHLADVAGYPDAVVERWMLHGAIVRQGRRTLSLGGATALRRDWGLSLEPADTAFTRRLGLVSNGRLVAQITLKSRLRACAARCLAALRADGVQAVSVLTEDPCARVPDGLAALGVDVVAGADRDAQRRWMLAASERGERIALVHTGLRDLLPPGGLSVCPIDADAGAHGVLLGDPLECLVAGRRVALTLRARMRLQVGAAVLANSGLLVASAMRAAPPIVTTTLHHLVAFAMLAGGMRIARVEARPIATTTPAQA